MHNTGNSIYRPYDQFINQMVLFGPVIPNRILLRASEWLAFFSEHTKSNIVNFIPQKNGCTFVCVWAKMCISGIPFMKHVVNWKDIMQKYGLEFN